MSAKIIDTHRYKTITKTQLEKKKKMSQEKLKSSNKAYQKKEKKANSDNSNIITNLRIKKHRERKLEREMLLYSRPQKTVIKEPKQKIYIPKSFIVTCLVIALVFIIYISAKIMGIDRKVSTVDVFGDSDNNDTTTSQINLEDNYELKIGLTAFNNTDIYTSSNLILNDLYKKTSLSLVKITGDYNITYEVARAIEKVSNSEYSITLNDKYKLNIDDIRYSINKILESGTENMYYSRVSIIDAIEETKQKNVFVLKLKEDNPYFIYYLDFPLLDDKNSIDGGYTYTLADNSVVFKRTSKNENKSLKSISLINYSNINTTVEDFVNNKIDLFFATSNNDMQLIGKKDYNVKKYKDGETLFIFGNKDSSIFQRKELRKSLMYSLNREDIVKNSDNNFIELIDLPFIYSSIKYKYDIVGSKNLMDSNDWNINQNGIYSKYENGNLVVASLRLLVNNEDTDKLNVANNIKNMAQNVGINIEIEALTSQQIQEKINSKDYDLLLATVYLNETPNVSFLREYLDINSATSQAFTQVDNSNSENLDDNIQNLEYVLSEEVACIGIYARNINLVYQKNISGFNDINYMRIFNNLENIGKMV